MGRKPKPTALKLVDGTRKSRVNTQEPRPEPLSEVPEPPGWLSEEAQGYWRELAPQMLSRGVLTSFDLHGFSLLCEAIDVHRRASESVNTEELVVKGDRGTVRNPALMIQRDAAQTIRSWSQEFGLTPAARSGIKLPQPATPDEARRLLS